MPPRGLAEEGLEAEALVVANGAAEEIIISL